MNQVRQQPEPCGVRLMRLMDGHLFEILRREQTNRNRIHLYGTGGYWAAFEQSAYQLCRLFAEHETAVVTHPSYPFPVVMAHIPDRALTAYSKCHIFNRDAADYKELVTEEIAPRHYRSWHTQEVRAFL